MGDSDRNDFLARLSGLAMASDVKIVDCKRKTIQYAEPKGMMGSLFKVGLSMSDGATGKFFQKTQKKFFGSEYRTYLTPDDIASFLL